MLPAQRRCVAAGAEMADFFVSFTSSDRAEAHWIGQELEKLGHVAHVHDWEIKGGDDIYAEALEAVGRANEAATVRREHGV